MVVGDVGGRVKQGDGSQERWSLYRVQFGKELRRRNRGVGCNEPTDHCPHFEGAIHDRDFDLARDVIHLVFEVTAQWEWIAVRARGDLGDCEWDRETSG